MRRLIDERRLGDSLSARIEVTGDMERELESIQQWKLDPSLSGGGFLMDVGSHRIELLLYLLGEVASVSAFVDYDCHSVDVRSNILFRFTSGALAMGAFNWTTNVATDDFSISGRQGKVVASPLGAGKLRLEMGQGLQEVDTQAPGYTHLSLIEHTVKALEHGLNHEVPGEVGCRVNQIIEAAYRSAREKRSASIDEAIG